MGSNAKFVAPNLGAETGRAVPAALDGERATLSEVLRFPNVPARTLNGLRMNVLHLIQDLARELADGIPYLSWPHAEEIQSHTTYR